MVMIEKKFTTQSPHQISSGVLNQITTCDAAQSAVATSSRGYLVGGLLLRFSGQTLFVRSVDSKYLSHYYNETIFLAVCLVLIQSCV